MKGNRKAWIAATSALAGVNAMLSIMALTALNGGGRAGLFEIGAGYDRRAERLLAPAQPPPPALRDAAALSHAATAQFPYDTSALLRLAYVDAVEHGALTPAGVAILDRSYDLVAIDPQLGAWRVGFALENSQALSRTLRVSVRKEAEALWLSGARRAVLSQMADTIRNPAGRLSLRLWLKRLERSVAR